ncbi:MAG: hypothetical protein FH756_05765 [Firmicutes bacterium]|nr:hypothetical protein [Bacillota bacterium]
MKDIILVNLNTLIFNDRQNCNMGLASIEAYLQSHGVNCRVINHNQVDEYKDSSPVFAFSVSDFSYEFAAYWTDKLQDKMIIWGGWTASALPEWLLQKNPGIDYVIMDEGEKRLYKLLKSCDEPELFAQLDGIAYRDFDNKIQIRPPAAYLNMDDLPYPGNLAVMNDLVFIELSRGCYGKCKYCQENSRMRFKTAKRIAEEIEHWIDKGYDRFNIGNANSLTNGKLLAGVLDEIEYRQLYIQIALVGRPNDVLRNQQVLERYFASRYIDLIFIEIGIEANAQRLLDLLGRTTTPQINEKATQTLCKLKTNYSSSVKINANIILFSHFEMTIHELIDNIRFLAVFGASRDVFSTHLYGLAGTAIWQEMEQQGFTKQERFALEIREYPFTDRHVHKLHQKLVQEPINNMLHSSRATVQDMQKIQHHCHDKLVDFYHLPDIYKAIMEYLEVD